VVNTIATVLHYVSSLSDYFFPKPSLVTILVIVGAIAGVGYLIRRRKAKKAEAQA
jgi:F0F1-type ATP synthase assembly protein I